MNRLNARRIPCACASLLLFGSAHAHMPYLLPNFFDIDKREHVTVQGSFTEEFFEPDVVMQSDDYHVIAPDGSKQALKPVYSKDLAVVEAPTPAPGTYRVSTGVRTGRVAKAAWVDGDWKFLERQEAAPAGSQAYDVTSVTTADVYVTRGKPNETALAPGNKGLEFRATTHPNAAFVGSEAQFTVLFDGKPVANQAVSVYRDHVRYSNKKIFAEVVTDSAGRFAVKPDRPGVYFAMARYRPAPAAGSTKGVSYTYSVVFEATD